VLGLQFPARDGIIVSTIVAEFLGADVLDRLCRILASDRLDESLRDPALREPASRQRLQRAMVEALERYCALHTADEIYRAGQSVGFPWAPCRTPDESLDDPHLHDRSFWVPVHHPELGRDFLYAGGPFVVPASPWRFARRPPLLGEHTAEVLTEARDASIV
jgi:crotonobetainyl-CoA:carnitine CoA-transferase CaiB-like acyl-CoA transferase